MWSSKLWRVAVLPPLPSIPPYSKQQIIICTLYWCIAYTVAAATAVIATVDYAYIYVCHYKYGGNYLKLHVKHASFLM